MIDVTGKTCLDRFTELTHQSKGPHYKEEKILDVSIESVQFRPIKNLGPSAEMWSGDCCLQVGKIRLKTGARSRTVK